MKKGVAPQTLSKQMTLFLLATSVFPIVLMGLLFYLTASTQINGLQNESIQYQNERIGKLVDLQLENSFMILESLKEKPEMALIIEHFYKEDQLTYAPQLSAIAIDLEKSMAQSKGLYEGIFMTDATGNVLIQQQGKESGAKLITVAGKDYFEKAMQGNARVIGKVTTSKVTGKRVIPVSVGIQANGKSIGTLIVYFDLKRLTDGFDSNWTKQKGFTAIKTDQQFIYSSNPALDKVIPTLNLKQLDKSLKRDVNGTTYYYEVKAMAGMNGIVISGMPHETYGAVGDLLKLGIAVALAVVLVMIAGAGLYMNRMIIEPIRLLSTQMKAVTTGTYEGFIGAVHAEELDHLKSAYNYMIEHMVAYTSGIEESSGSFAEHANALTRLSESSKTHMRHLDAAIMQIETYTKQQENLSLENQVVLNTLREDVEAIVVDSRCIHDLVVENETQQDALNTCLNGLSTSVEANTTSASGLFNQLNLLVDTVSAITPMVNTIESISKKTNILAINAAIEASRAGESGRGFAVVAEEIRTLSDNIREETKTISHVVKNLIAESKGVTGYIGTNQKTLESQREALSYTSQSFEKTRLAFTQIIALESKISGSVMRIQDTRQSVEKAFNHVRETAFHIQGETGLAIHLAHEQGENINQLAVMSNHLHEQSMEMQDLINQ